MVRKIVVLFTVSLLFAATFLQINTTTQASSLTLSLPTAEAKAGGTVDIPIHATGATGIGALQLDLVYDNKLLSPDAVSKGVLLGSNALLQSETKTPGRVMLALATLEGFKGDGVIINVRFKVTGQAGQTSPLKLENALAWEGATHQDVMIKSDAGQIKITGGAGFPLWIIIAIIVVILLLIILLIVMRKRNKQNKPAN
jgi:hypothetical protein